MEMGSLVEKGMDGGNAMGGCVCGFVDFVCWDWDWGLLGTMRVGGAGIGFMMDSWNVFRGIMYLFS